MKRLVMLALLLVSGAAAAATIGTPAQVSAALDQQGAQAFFSSLSDDDAEKLFDQISTGQAAWVALAPRLAAGADAGNAEGLGIALATALPKNPKAVLAVTDPVDADGHPIAVSRVCGIPFIETVPAGYKAKAVRAVRGVNAEQLKGIRARCLTELEKS